jgi:hypothetical protein
MIVRLILIAIEDRRIEDSIATPSSVKANGFEPPK